MSRESFVARVGFRVLLLFCALFAAACRVSPTGTLIGPSVGSQGWRVVRSEHFTLRTDTGETEAREISIDMERTYGILREVGFLLDKDPRISTDVVVFQSQEAYKTIAPRGSAGFFASALARGGYARPTFVTYGGLSDSARTIFVHELTHRFVYYVCPQAPVWLNEGLADYFETVTVDGGKAVLGRAAHALKKGESWTYGAPGVPADSLPPLGELLALDHQTFYPMRGVSEEPRGNAAFREASRKQAAHYASSWAMVHALLNGPAEGRARLLGWIEKMAGGMRAQDAFVSAFQGMSEDDLDAARRAMVNRFVTGDITVLRTDHEAKGAPPVEERPMRPVEIDLLWGWLHLRAAPDVTTARAHAESASKADPSSAEAHVLRAFVAAREKDWQRFQSEIREAARVAPDDEAAAAFLFSLEAYGAGGPLTPGPKAAVDGLVAKWLPRARLDTTLNELAWYLLLHGRADEALPAAKRATLADPSCAECFDTLAAALSRTGDHKSAADVQEIAISLLGERRAGDVDMLERLRRYRAVRSAIVLWQKRPEPGKDPALLPDSVIRAVLEAQLPFVTDCYEDVLETSPGIAGKLLVHGEIGVDGKAIRARALPPEEWGSAAGSSGSRSPPQVSGEAPATPITDERVIACAVDNLMAARFPPSSEPRSYRFPVVLAPSKKK